MEIMESRRIECQLSPLCSEARFDEGSGQGERSSQFLHGNSEFPFDSLSR
jgi:hypothetical protein